MKRDSFFRGIASIFTAWLFACLLLPFIYGGFAREGVAAYGDTFIIFVLGSTFLIPGAAVWMLPFCSAWVRRCPAFLYHLWVSLGAFIALWSYLAAQFSETFSPLYMYYAPQAAAVIMAFGASCFYSRDRNPRVA